MEELFDSRLGQESGVWSRQKVVLPELLRRTWCRSARAIRRLFDRQALADQLGLSQIHIKQCGTSHTGSFKDLGMTVRLDGQPDPSQGQSRRLRVDRRYVRRALSLLRGGRHSVHRLSSEGQGDYGPIDSTDIERFIDVVVGHGFRWLHEDRSRSYQRWFDLSC